MWQDSDIGKACANFWIVTGLTASISAQTVPRISIRFATEKHEPETSAFLQDSAALSTLREM